MKQLNLFYKIMIMIMPLLLLTGCSTIPSTDQADGSKASGTPVSMDEEEKNPEYSYGFSVVDTSELRDLPWIDKFSFKIIQVKEMPEDRLDTEATINENLKKAMTSWVGGKVMNADSVSMNITCHSCQYLSVTNTFVYNKPYRDFINDHITIDMTTGQRVFLDDLIKVDEKFVEFLQENPDIVKMPVEAEPWQVMAYVNSYSSYELLEGLKKCSYTQEYLIQNGYNSLEDSLGSLLHRNSFFLRNGMLVITFEKGYEGFISLDLDDIEDFLKVDKW